jgi:hypothetical protein
MVRFRLIRQVRLGHFPQAVEAAEALSAREQALAGPEATQWLVFGGPVNTLITETEFSSLRTYEEWQEKTDADAEHIRLRGKAAEHSIEGTTRVEILKTAPHLARDESVPFAVRG